MRLIASMVVLILTAGCRIWNPTEFNKPSRALAPAPPAFQSTTNWQNAGQLTDPFGRVWFVENQAGSDLLRFTPAYPSGTFTNKMREYYRQRQRANPPPMPP